MAKFDGRPRPARLLSTIASIVEKDNKQKRRLKRLKKAATASDEEEQDGEEEPQEEQEQEEEQDGGAAAAEDDDELPSLDEGEMMRVEETGTLPENTPPDGNPKKRKKPEAASSSSPAKRVPLLDSTPPPPGPQPINPNNFVPAGAKGKPLQQSTINPTKLAPAPSKAAPATAAAAKPVLDMSKNKAGQFKLDVGSRVRIGESVWRCTYKGLVLPTTEKKPDDDAMTLGPECFWTFFNESHPTKKDGSPNYEVYVVTENPVANPLRVIINWVKIIEGNLSKLDKKAYDGWVTSIIKNRNVVEDKELGVYRMLTTPQSYKDKLVKISKTLKQMKTAKAKGKAPAAEPVEKEKASAKEKPVEKKAAAAAAAAAAPVDPRKDVLGAWDEVKHKYAFLDDSKFVLDLWGPAFMDFMKSVSAKDLTEMLKSASSKIKSVVAKADAEEAALDDEHKGKNPLRAFEKAQTAIGPHVVDIALLLPFMNSTFRRMVEDKIRDEDASTRTALPPPPPPPAPASPKKKGTITSLTKYKCSACQGNAAGPVCNTCGTPRSKNDKTHSPVRVTALADVDVVDKDDAPESETRVAAEKKKKQDEEKEKAKAEQEAVAATAKAAEASVFNPAHASGDDDMSEWF